MRNLHLSLRALFFRAWQSFLRDCHVATLLAVTLLIFPSTAIAQLLPGEVECKPTPASTGYFIAYFEEVALANGQGYNDAVYGANRQAGVCNVLIDLANLLNFEGTHAKPEILFTQNPANVGGSLPPDALAAASSYFSHGTTIDNGHLYKHIMTGQDPVPGIGNFDAFVITNFYGTIQWSVDSNLNSSTYDFSSVITHEILHALGFRSKLSAVIGQTNVPAPHGTFDLNLYDDNTLTVPFFDPAGPILQVPVGAPPASFISNGAVYDGVLNAPGAVLDGDRPLYTPTVWQEGSSLSHFDMNRASGQTYVMHPSIGTNTQRNIDNDEKEVLCHMGYAVTGMPNCDFFTPAAVNDGITLIPLTPVCVSPLANDKTFNTGAVLSINNVDLGNIQPGDIISYFSMNNCTGTIPPNTFGAKSFRFTPTAVTAQRVISYDILDSVSNRISSPAKIIMGSCNNPPGEYVCNGGFEEGVPVTTPLDFDSMWCGSSKVSFWCSSLGTADYFIRNGVSANSFSYSISQNFFTAQIPGGVNTHNATPNDRYVGVYNTNLNGGSYEGILSDLTQPLIAGNDYIFSFYIYPVHSGYSGGTPYTEVFIGTQSLGPLVLVADQWNFIQIPFTATQAHANLRIEGSVHTIGNFYNFIDDVSLTGAVGSSVTNSIKGKVFDDQNNNGIFDNITETGLSGIQVGLFQPGQTVPMMTTTTSAIPYLGDYEFNNISDGTYYVALMNEGVYPSITQPGINAGIIPGYLHVHTAAVAGGQMANRDFGVKMSLPPTVDISINKVVNTSTLNQGYVTYTINITNQGTNPAHNVVARDVLPTGVTYLSHTMAGGTYNPVTGQITIGTLNPGQTLTLNIIVKVKFMCGQILNKAEFISANESDVNAANNIGTAIFYPAGEIPCADIGVQKSVHQVIDLWGFYTIVIYDVAVTNYGPSNALSLDVGDPLSSNLIFINATVTQGTASYDSPTHTVKFTVANLVSGATVHEYIQVLVNSSVPYPTVISNRAWWTRLAGAIDTNFSNDASSVDVTVGRHRRKFPWPWHWFVDEASTGDQLESQAQPVD